MTDESESVGSNPLNEATSAAGRPLPDEIIGLCLSGGGYRAMLFHVGSLWRLYEAGLLGQVGRISSVSGGSITAGQLALSWQRLFANPQPDVETFRTLVCDPICNLASHTIDIMAGAAGLLVPGAAGKIIAKLYGKYLYGTSTLHDFPDTPRFVINATSLQSGVLWRFTKRYIADYRVGRIDNVAVAVSRAVAASSAFPPMLSPVTLTLDPKTVTKLPGSDLYRPPFTSKAVMADGGVYDNLGLETVWKRCRTVLVSDAGGHFGAQAHPKFDWPRQTFRVLDLIDSQVRSLRSRQLIASYRQSPTHPDHREGTYWGIRTEISKYPAAHFPVTTEETARLASIPTRLKKLPDKLQKRLINWGYAVCDAAIRSYWKPNLPVPPNLPFVV